jgi:cysteine desulfurase
VNLPRREQPVYLDAQATTPCDPRVVEAMLPFFTERFGNAASRQHPFGWAARDAVETARGQLAALLRAKPKDLVFTSGATESNNLAIKGIAAAHRARGRHIVIAATEHRAVLDPCEWLAGEGFEVTTLPVEPDGLLDVARLEAALRPDTILVSVMTANNEIGTLQPIAAIGRLTRARDIAFHTDAAQAAGKIPLDVEALGVDLLSVTAHKMYGPKGVGALFVRRRGPAAALAPSIHGGGHERGLRSGTLNVPAIVGFGEAAAICGREMPAESVRLAGLRDRLLAGLRERIDDVRVNGPEPTAFDPTASDPAAVDLAALDPAARDSRGGASASELTRLPHNLNVAFPGVEGASLLMALTDVAVSSGAACSSASAEPSHVLRALGLPDDLAKASLRFGLGRWTTAEEVDFAAGRVADIVASLRARRLAIRG